MASISTARPWPTGRARLLVVAPAGRVAAWLDPRPSPGQALSSPKIFADDTPVPVLDPGRGRTKTGRLWSYARDDGPWQGPLPPAVAYVYGENRQGVHPQSHLAAFAGVLQVDGYAGSKRWPGRSARRVRCSSPSVGRTPGASSLISTMSPAHRSPPSSARSGRFSSAARTTSSPAPMAAPKARPSSPH
jgi:hypothetical protein